MTLRAVVFDLFDTLVDVHMDRLPEIWLHGRRFRSTYGAIFDALRRHVPIEFEPFGAALLAVDREWRDAAYKEGREVTTEQRFEQLVARLGIEAPDLPAELTAVHMGKLRELVETHAHHVEVLRELRGRLRTGVCSNFTDTPTAVRVLEEAGLVPHLDAIVISADVGVRKPRPEIFIAALAQLGVNPEQAIHVGDNLAADVEGAAGVGMRTVWVHRRVTDPDAALAAYAGPPPTAVVADLAELPALLADPRAGLS